MAFGLSTPIVTKTRSMLARRSPASTILEFVDAVVDCSRAAGRPLAAAVFDDYVIRVGDDDKAQWVLAPLNLPVEMAAELAFSCARDCLAFIQNLDFPKESTVQDAEKHLRGVLNAASLLNSLVLTVPSAAFARRLFGQDLSRAAIVHMLSTESLHAFLFRLAQRERVSSHEDNVQWTDDQVVDALVKLCAAALVEKSHRDGILEAFEFIRTITEEYLRTSFLAAVRILDEQHYAIQEFLHRGARELGTAAQETFLTGDTEQVYRIVEFAYALRDASNEAGMDIFEGDRGVLHALLSMSTGHQAFELWQYVRLGAALVDVQMAFEQPNIAGYLVAEFLDLFSDREVSSAHDPAFWTRVVERSEAMKFRNVAATIALLRRAATVQPESALAIAAKALCSQASPNGEPRGVLLQFIQELRKAVVERINSRYHPTQSPLNAVQRGNEQSARVLCELYDALPSFLRRRAFQERLLRFANLHSDVIEPEWNVIFFEAHETINAYIAELRITGKRAREEVAEPREKRPRKELDKEIER